MSYSLAGSNDFYFYGDTTGDGKVNGADLLKVARYVSNDDKDLEGAYKIAADVIENENQITINIDDVIKIAKMLVELE